MEKIPLPTTIKFVEGEQNIATLTIEPLYPGYGTTFGNALRRVLLSSIPGVAVTALKIRGVDHDFSTIPGVEEDLIDIILTFKQLRLKILSDTDEEIRLELKVNNEGVVTASQISKNADVEIVNPDLKLFTLSEKSKKVEMEIFVKKGRGFVATEQRPDREEVGVIDVDSIYVPLLNVGYNVSNVRVGQMTNFDKLVMTIQTDGTISGKDAVAYASEILMEHFNLLSESNLLETLHKQDEERRKLEQEQKEASQTVTDVAEEGLSAGSNEVEENESPKKKRGRPKKSEAEDDVEK